MRKILVTGACGQIGSELIMFLREECGADSVIATDIKEPSESRIAKENFLHLDVLDAGLIARIVEEHQIDTIFHMAAILSAVGEKNPQLAYTVNLQGLMNVLEVARKCGVKKVITPSSIAVFGPDVPRENTPNDISLNPTTMYGVTKVAGEKLLQYYYLKFGIDTRTLRYPGIISSETPPGGGTTDFAVDLYVHAVSNQPYVCYIAEQTPLPFMYMPDAIRAIWMLAEASPENLRRRVYNVHSMKLTPGQIVEAIRKFIPGFSCVYQTDFRQEIAESWPYSLDDLPARQDWGWKPEFDLEAMTRDMIQRLRRKY